MKIAYIASSEIPSRSANSIHVMKMCQAFSKNGHEVILIVPKKKRKANLDISDVFAYYGVERCFKIIKLPWLPIVGRQLIYGFMAALKARLLGFDLIYSRNNPATIFSAMLQLAVIFEVHAPFANKSKVLDLLFIKLVRSVKLYRIVVITQNLKHYFVGKYPASIKKIIVVPDGADPLPADVKPVIFPNFGRRMQVGYVGHLYPGKGMEIVSKLAPNCSWADFHVVGGSEGDLKHWKKICRTCSNITFHGYVAHQFVATYIRAFDALLLPNQDKVDIRGDYGPGDIGKWTSPLKAFEYMAAAKPIICSDLPVLREIFAHNINALLCPPTNLIAWTSALACLRDDLSLQIRLGETAQTHFIENYTWSIRAKKVLENSRF